MPEAKLYRAADLRVGMSAEFDRRVSVDDIMDFARTSGDFNPLHVDPEYAARTNYGSRIAHGAFQIGLASAMLGMHLPGRNALLTLLNAQFPAPLRFPCCIRVRGEIIAWNADNLAGRLRVTVSEVPSGTITADIGVGFSLHEEHAQRSPQPSKAAASAETGDRPLILVTGASGGIGAQVARGLSERYDVLAVHNRTLLPDDLAGSDHVRPLALDFSQPDWPLAAVEALSDRDLYGVVHCAWPGAPQGGLLRVPMDALQTQLNYGTVLFIELAKLMANHARAEGGRLVAIGSSYGSLKPKSNLAAYSLAKATLEHAVRLLAAELAGKRITVNAVCPSFVPAGMNQQVDQRRQKMEAAQVPLGRLCQPDDVADAVCWLVSPGASFVSGQVLGLTGAQL